MGQVGQLGNHGSPSGSEAAADTDPVQAQTGAASARGCKTAGMCLLTHVAPATTVTDFDEET